MSDTKHGDYPSEVQVVEDEEYNGKPQTLVSLNLGLIFRTKE